MMTHRCDGSIDVEASGDQRRVRESLREVSKCSTKANEIGQLKKSRRNARDGEDESLLSTFADLFTEEIEIVRVTHVILEQVDRLSEQNRVASPAQ